MNKDIFVKLLKEAGLSKKELASVLGISYSTVTNWGSSKRYPYWVKTWLINYIKAKRYDQLKEIIENSSVFAQNSR